MIAYAYHHRAFTWVLVLLYLAFPAHGWALNEGIPLAPFSIAIFVLALWLFLFSDSKPFAVAFLMLAIFLKAILGSVAISPKGFKASYFLGESWTPPHQRSFVFPEENFSRIDSRLHFEGRRAFPTFFWNELRYNSGQPGQPSRDAFAFTAEWTGWIPGKDIRTKNLFLRRATPNRSESAVLWINDHKVAEIPDGQTTISVPNLFKEGLNKVTLRYRAPYSSPRGLFLGFHEGKRDRALSEKWAYASPLSSPKILLDVCARGIAWIIDLGILLGLFFTLFIEMKKRLSSVLRTEKAFSSVLPVLGLIGSGLLFIRSWPLRFACPVLSAGDDWLGYESGARDILLNGPLMLEGQVLGKASAFYNQPLYPYFLAFLHWLTGENYFGIYFIQQCLLFLIPFAIYFLAKKYVGSWGGIIGGVWALFFICRMEVINMAPHELSHSLLTESLFLPLVFLLMVLVELWQNQWQERPLALLLIGFIAGLTWLTRSTIAPTVLLIVGFVGWRRGIKGVLFFLIPVFLLIGLVSTRNFMVSGKWVITNSYGPINLYVAHEPPPHIEIKRAKDRWWTHVVDPHPLVSAVIEYAVQDPIDFIRGTLNRGHHNLWVTQSKKEKLLFRWVWLTALVGFSVIGFRQLLTGTLWLPAFISISHFLILMMLSVHTYGNRMLYIVYLPLIVFSSRALTCLRKWIMEFTRIKDAYARVNP